MVRAAGCRWWANDGYTASSGRLKMGGGRLYRLSGKRLSVGGWRWASELVVLVLKDVHRSLMLLFDPFKEKKSVSSFVLGKEKKPQRPSGEKRLRMSGEKNSLKS